MHEHPVPQHTTGTRTPVGTTCCAALCGMHTATPRHAQSCTCCCCLYPKHRLAAANSRDPHRHTRLYGPSIHGHGCGTHTRRRNYIEPKGVQNVCCRLDWHTTYTYQDAGSGAPTVPFLTHPVTSCSTNSHLSLAHSQKAVSLCTPQCCDVFSSSSHHAAADGVCLRDLY